MKFSINTMIDNGSGMKYNNKDEFLKEISNMIDDCTENGGTYFRADIYTDKSPFYKDDEE